MKFKIGDKVRVRTYDKMPDFWVDEMMEFQSKTLTIEYEESCDKYVCKECIWTWRECDLISLEKSNIRKQAEAIADLIEKKEKDYDSAFSKSYKEFGMTSVAIRLSDKVERLKNLVKGEKPNFESIDDTLMDIAGYAILALAERKED